MSEMDLFIRGLQAGLPVNEMTASEIRAALSSDGKRSKKSRQAVLVFHNVEDGTVAFRKTSHNRKDRFGGDLTMFVSEVLSEGKEETVIPDTEDLSKWKVGRVEWLSTDDITPNTRD